MRVAIIRGGPGAYHTSLDTGGHVLTHLRPRHEVQDIFIDRDGAWHRLGLVTTPDRALGSCDVIFNCLHGAYGEDGTLQSLLDNLGHKYIGSDRVSCALAYNKALTKEVLRQAGIAVPSGMQVSTDDDPHEVAVELFRTMGGQYVIKPLKGSMSDGVRVVRAHTDVVDTLIEALLANGEVLVEEVVRGREVKVGVVEGLRGEELYALMPIEIRKNGDLSVYTPHGGNNFVIPGRFSREEKELLISVARQAHQALGARGYSMVDIIMSRQGPVVLEVDTHPALGVGLPMHESLDALGVSQVEFLEHLLATA